jgi:hypothetical protein
VDSQFVPELLEEREERERGASRDVAYPAAYLAIRLAGYRETVLVLVAAGFTVIAALALLIVVLPGAM